MSIGVDSKSIFEIEGYEYFVRQNAANEYKPGRFSHFVITPDGTRLVIRWHQNSMMRPTDFKNWLKVGKPLSLINDAERFGADELHWMEMCQSKLLRQDILTVKNQLKLMKFQFVLH